MSAGETPERYNAPTNVAAEHVETLANS